MAIKFNKLKVIDVKQETSDSASISFLIPLYLKEEYIYKHGQYLTIKVDIDGESNRRAYSISTSPLEDKPITVTIKQPENGKVSKYLTEQVKPGDFLDVMPPLGHFTIDLDDENAKQYVLFGGGSGVTPLMSILKTVLIKEPKSNVYLIYANKTSDSIIFKSEIEELEAKYPENFKIIHILTQEENWQGLKERLSEENVSNLINQLLNNNLEHAEFFMCGPNSMMKSVENGLEKLGINKTNIHKESFTAPIENDSKKEDDMSKKDLVARTIRLKIYGEEHTIEVLPDENITVAAMRKALDPPFSCQIGACSTCRAKVKSGSVMMDENEALTQDEMNKGYILACQAHPLTDDVYIDMDDN